MIDFPDLTDAEKAFRRALSEPRLLRQMARELRAEWEWRQAAEALRRFYTRALSRSGRRT
jgi:hypothetical protein